MFWITFAAAVFTGVIVVFNWKLWQRAKRQSELILIERLMTEYDGMRDSIRELQRWKRERGGVDIHESFKALLRTKDKVSIELDEHRHRVDKLDEAVCDLNKTPFGDADRLFYQAFLRSLPD